MAPAEARQRLRVQVVYSPRAGEVDEVQITVLTGATVADALSQSQVLQRHPEIDAAALRVGVWGKRCAPGDTLRDRDRVEIYRPLQVDPKEARRLRYRQHKERLKSRA